MKLLSSEIEKFIEEVAVALGVDRSEAIRRMIRVLEAGLPPQPPTPPAPMPFAVAPVYICGLCGQAHGTGGCPYTYPVNPLITYGVRS